MIAILPDDCYFTW